MRRITIAQNGLFQRKASQNHYNSEASDFLKVSEEKQIEYIIHRVMKGILNSIEADFGKSSIFKADSDHVGADGLYIGKFDNNLCSWFWKLQS